MAVHVIPEFKKYLESLENEKIKINKPILSEDQVKEMEIIIYESFINKNKIEFIIYEAGYLNNYIGVIDKLYSTNKKIILKSKKSFYFCEIISVRIIGY